MLPFGLAQVVVRQILRFAQNDSVVTLSEAKGLARLADAAVLRQAQDARHDPASRHDTPGNRNTVSAMRSTKGAGKTPMNTRKAMSTAPANCSVRSISLRSFQRSLKGPKKASESMRRMYTAVMVAPRMPRAPKAG